MGNHEIARGLWRKNHVRVHGFTFIGIEGSGFIEDVFGNSDEWETMKSHVVFGAKILEPLKPLARIREMVHHHHEYFDGSGYPHALRGENIPLGARIVAVADAYDTITSD